MTDQKNRDNFLPQIVSQPDYKIRSAIYFEGQNKGKLDQLRVNGLTGLEGKTPILEFKKINPTKYRIRVHGAKETFPLVFSESFHEGWKAYLAKPNNFQFPKSKQISILKFQTTNYSMATRKIKLLKRKLRNL